MGSSNRHIPMIWGLILCGIGLLLMVKFDSTILWLIGLTLGALGLISIKIGFTASDKALKDLTSVSEETKKEINDKL